MFGREAGDAAIAHTTQGLPAVFRATDLVARTHDDEFIVLMKDVSSLDAIECIAGLVLQLLRCPCGTQEHAVEATVSVGIAMSDGQTSRTFNDLYDNACTALFDAKRAKDHRFVIYDCNGKPARGQYGFDRLVNASTPNYQPFLDTLANGGVLLRAEPKGSFVPQYFSDSFLALLGGMAREEALSVYGDDMVAGMHPDDRQRMRDEIKESLSAETPLRTIARMRKAGGGYVWVSIFAVWTREHDGRVNASAIHSSVESIIENYDYAYSGVTQSAAAGMPLYMFAVTFADGNPSGYTIFDENGVRLSGLEDAFNARTTRMAAIMRQRMRRRMRNGFALCDAWSDAMPSLSKLLEEAGTSVYGDRSIFFPDERSRALSTMPSFQRAFDGDAFSVRLQPQVDLKTGEVVGSEALARCLTPSGETIPPSEFIPRMEAEGNVSGLDYFVFEKVLATLNDWTDRGLKPLPVAVNFSRQTVLDPSFVASILALTSRYDVPEDLLEIEITESMGAFKNMELRGAMETLRGQGFRFALDDLGSEYSTLSAMSDLPFDTVKLDRLLVRRFADDSMSRSIVEGIARACEKNGIRCVAEGVEFPSYIELLVSMGCHYGQGYCFARPMTIDQFTNEYLVDANEDAERTIPIPKGDGEEVS